MADIITIWKDLEKEEIPVIDGYLCMGCSTFYYDKEAALSCERTRDCIELDTEDVFRLSQLMDGDAYEFDIDPVIGEVRIRYKRKNS